MYPLFTTGFISNNLNLFYALFIGIAFGYIIERGGFGKSTHIAPVFFFRNSKVTQMMISAILTSGALLAFSVYNGWVDYNQVYIPATHVWPYLVGGIIFGIGMVMSGWCPGTALVGFSTGKIDATVFMLGLLAGMYVYFDQFDKFINFANGSNLGRYTIDKLVGGNIYTSFLITVLLGIGVSIFMNVMIKIQKRKGE